MSHAHGAVGTYALATDTGRLCNGETPLVPLSLPCTWGTYPLSYRMGSARIEGCKLPNAARHGHFVGGPGA